MISRSIRFTWRLERLLSLLLWLVATTATRTTAAAPLQEGEYYRPLPPEASGRVATTAAYRRSPCPAINALANHGYIARDGRAITAQALKTAVMKHFTLDNRYADTLVALAKKPVFDLNELSAHNVVEHDMSLVHKDAFFGEDPATTDAALIADLVGHVGAAGVLDPWFFARTQQRRLRACMALNPQCEFSNEFLLSVTLGRQGLLMRVMGGKNVEAVDLETAKMLLIEEKLSSNWTVPSQPVSQDDIQNSRRRLFALLQASGEWLGDGFGSTSQTLVSDANVTQCLDVSNKTPALSSCDNANKFLLDGQQRLRVAGGGCIEIALASSTTPTSITEAPCREKITTAQQWWYDASGRLRPVQAPDSCLDLVTTGSTMTVTTAVCSTRTEQRFVSFYANFQPSGSRLASMDTPRFCLGLAVGTTPSSSMELVATPCDTMDETQELTLDERKRLVFTNGNTQCVDLTGDTADPVALTQKPCSDRLTKWQYDSLSRLRPSAALSKCVQLSPTGTNQRQVVLTDCGDGLPQKWFISDTKDPNRRPADQFYRPNVFESSGKPGTTATYSRSPCPALNALANHGLLPRSGRNLTAEQVQQAVVDHFNIDPAYAQVLVKLATTTNRRTAVVVSFNLDALSLHNAAEHDMSLVHADAFFGQDPAVTDPTLAAELVRHVGASGNMDVLFFARTQARRLRECQARNPQCDFSNDFLMSVALGRLGLLMRAMGGQNQELVGLDRVRSFLVDEQIPVDFVKSATPVTQKDIQDTRIRIDALLASSSEWLVEGFLNNRKGVSIVSEGGGSGHALCLAITSTIGSETVAMNTSLVVATCDDAKREQKWRMDDLHRVVSESSGLCLAALDFGTLAGTAVVQLECVDDASYQLWTYDASGRLRPAHAATLCLDVGSGTDAVSVVETAASEVTLSECGASSRQRFYSTYDGFQPNASHLNSIELSELCLSVAGASTADGARVDATACDPLLVEQQLTLDAAGRLVFAHSAKCLAHDPAGTIVQATCTSGEKTQRWQYDSLGRLHPASTQNQCLALKPPASGTAPVLLTDCSDSAAQRWHASDAKDPNNRPQNAYYRPNRDESSGRVGTTATYSRSPCPALNALANHGILRRDGRNISRIDLVGAVVATFNIEPALAEAFLSGLPDDSDYLNLDQLSGGVFDYKGSLLHSDAFFNPDPAAIDPDLVSDLFARVGSGNGIDVVYMVAAQRRRLDAHARSMGTSSETTLSSFKYQKPGLLLRVLGATTNQATVAAEMAKLLLVEERLPDAFVKPSIAVALDDVLDSAATVQSMIETGGASASGQGGASVAWLSQPFHPKREPIYTYKGDGVASCLSLTNGVLTLATCNATSTSQQFTYDAQQRLVVESTVSCLDVVDGKVGHGVAVSHVDCTDWRHQKWIYDASGRLHPQHAPKFCLSVGDTTTTTTSKGVITKCSDSRDQQFFTAFTSLAMTDKQLVSVAPKSPKGPLTRCLSMHSSMASLSVEQCADAKPQQLFSLDTTQRLVAQVSRQCVSATSDGKSATPADCAAQPHGWTYDSLGRMHPQSSLASCLTANTNANAVALETCSLAASQRWLVARLKPRTPNVSSGDGPGKESLGTTMNRQSAGLVAVALAVVSSLVAR